MWVPAFAQKTGLDDVLAKHLDAIGTKKARTDWLNLIAVGDVGYTQGSIIAKPSMGRVAIASEGEKMLLAMTFTSSLYQQEKFTSDGKNQKIGFSRPGVRSPLGEFLMRNNGIIKNGLLGGVLSKNWILDDANFHDSKISLEGSKKIDGHDTYVLDCSPKKGSDVRIKLFIEKDTFRHVRTEYLFTVSPLMSHDPNTSAGQVDNREDLVEDFSDFKTEYGLTLPRTYKIHFFIQRGSGSVDYYYTLGLKDLYYNSTLEAGTFTGDSK
jgi:hypothetical protein